MRIKICGLTRPGDAALAESLGADYLGVIMAGGPRNLSEADAATVLGTRRHTVRRVAVFGSQPIEEIAAIAERLDVDVIQLHSSANASDISWLHTRVNCAVWPVLRVEGTVLPEYASELAEVAGALLLDAKVVGQLGGTGVALDWRGLAGEVLRVRAELPATDIILAGGLRQSNIREAIRLLAPDVVDVSSGVESLPGIKDEGALRAFFAEARAVAPRSEQQHDMNSPLRSTYASNEKA